MGRSFIHKGALIAVCLAWGLLGTTAEVKAQEQQTHLVQAAVDGLRNAHHSEQAAQLLRSAKGIHMARFDQHTRNMMLHVDAGLVMDRADINELLEPIGVSVRCLQREALGASPFRHVNADDCPDLVPTTR
jgi:hypothetical protein